MWTNCCEPWCLCAMNLFVFCNSLALWLVCLQRNTLKRLCIKTLPPVLCIQLKRFDYDWEANRALKFDDYFKVKPAVYDILVLLTV